MHFKIIQYQIVILIGCWIIVGPSSGCSSTLTVECPKYTSTYDNGTCICVIKGDAYCEESNKCVRFKDDPNNCSSCGYKCPDTFSCISGLCKCSEPTKLCNNKCESLDTKMNCGSCGNQCQANEVCFNPCLIRDNCYRATKKCAECKLMSPKLIKCGDKCVFFNEDRNHCGGCGIKCSPNQECKDGKCVPCQDVGLFECDGKCVNVMKTREHCGKCGNKCTGVTRACWKGKCSECNDNYDCLDIIPNGRNFMCKDGGCMHLCSMIKCDVRCQTCEIRFGSARCVPEWGCDP